MHEQLQWILLILGNMALISIAVAAFARWTRGETGAAVSMVLGAAAIAGVVFFPDALTGLLHDFVGTFLGPNDADTATPSPPQPKHDPDPAAVNIPWGAIASGAGLLLALAAVGALLHLLHHHHQRRAKDQLRRTELEARHDQVLNDYAAFVTDILAVLDRPALADITVAETVRLIHALDAARDARTNPGADYRAAVTELEIAWKAADRHARKQGTDLLPAPERRAVQQARLLLTTALDEGGNSHERQLAYRHAMRLIEDIIDVPKEAVAELADTTRLSLPPRETPQTVTLTKTKDHR